MSSGAYFSLIIQLQSLERGRERAGNIRARHTRDPFRERGRVGEGEKRERERKRLRRISERMRMRKTRKGRARKQGEPPHCVQH